MFRGRLKIHLMIKTRLLEQKLLSFFPKSVCGINACIFQKEDEWLLVVLGFFFNKQKLRNCLDFFPSSKDLDLNFTSFVSFLFGSQLVIFSHCAHTCK